LPIPVRTDWSQAGEYAVKTALLDRPDVAVFDFVHAAVLAPGRINVPSVLFTHNVETEIFQRHAKVATNPVSRWIWSNQAKKMRVFESAALARFDVTVAVSDRDAKKFQVEEPQVRTAVIPTGVDLDYFGFHPPTEDKRVVFCGSMDWLANQDAIKFFLEEVWDLISAQVPDAKMTVVGRSPPANLVDQARRRNLRWDFTGYVDDVRPYMQGAAVSVIPIRVGGGTRLKAYEAMAAGNPIVSTAIGIEGLPIVDGEHYLRADEAKPFAAAVVSLLRDVDTRMRIATQARALVESRFSYVVAARVFEDACTDAVSRFHSTRA